MKQKLLLGFIFILLSSLVYSQDQCGNEPTEAQIQYLSKTRTERQTYRPEKSKERNASAFDWIPINLVMFRNNSGTNDGYGEYEILSTMKFLNAAFFDQHIQFFQCGPTQIINSTVLYDIDVATEESLLNAYDVSNAINVYIFNTLKNGTTQYCGISYLPPSLDRILLSKDIGCTLSKSVIHEMGHYFSLYHTHGKTSGLTDELVNGSNCGTAGDDICDTPADPNLSGNTNYNTCAYTGTLLDANQQPYYPDPSNHMSYAWTQCRNSFTAGQKARMAYSLANDRNYLTACTHPAQCENPITNYPATFDFETGMEGWWNGSYVDYVTIPYTQYSGPTNNAGPTSAQSGTKFISLNSAQNMSEIRLSMLRSPCFDLSSMNNPHITFHYYLTGSPSNGFGIQIGTDAGYNWPNVPVLIQIYGDQGASWQTFDLDLTPYKNEEIVQFRILGVYEAFDLSDISFDNISVYDANASCNLAGTISSNNALCYGSSTGSASTAINGNYAPPLTYAWSNGATSASINNLASGYYDVTVTDNNGCVYQSQVNIDEPAALATANVVVNNSTNGGSNGSIIYNATGGSLPYSYIWSSGQTTSSIGGLSPGTYTITTTDANGCSLQATYSIANQLTCNQTFSSFPYNNSFESNLGIFVQESADNFNWTKRSGSTPTSNTGPSSAYNGSYYYYTEATGNSPNKTAILKTDACLDLTGVSNPIFKLYYHMFGSQMGSFKIEISTDNEQTWTTVFSKSGNQGNSWKTVVVDLAPYQSGPIKIRLIGQTGNGQKSDMAIDKCFIGSNPTPDILYETSDLSYQVFPNPINESFHVVSKSNDFQIGLQTMEIFDSLGKRIKTISKAEIKDVISTEELTSGQYLLRLTKINGSTETLKIVVIK